MKLFGTRRRLAAAELAVEELARERDAANRHLADAATRTQLLEAENGMLTTDNTSLRRAYDAMYRECCGLRETSAALGRQNASLLADVNASIPLIQAAETERDDLAAQLAVVEGRLTRLVRPRTADPSAGAPILTAVAP